MENRKLSGVYCITNRFTKEKYVGSSSSIGQRWLSHLSSLRKPSLNMSQGLSDSYASYQETLQPEEVFELEVLEKTVRLKERERFWIKELQPTLNKRVVSGSDDETVAMGVLTVSLKLGKEEIEFFSQMPYPRKWAARELVKAIQRTMKRELRLSRSKITDK